MAGSAVLTAYLAVKLVVYVLVCLLGIVWMRPDVSRPLAGAMALGAFRVGLGVGLGLLIYLASTSVYASLPRELPRGVTTYLAVYVPARWLEWSLVAALITRPARSLSGFLIGSGPRDRLWRALGIAASCAADIPVILSIGGLPVGRFFC